MNSLIYSFLAHQKFTFNIDDRFIPRYMNSFFDTDIFSAVFPKLFLNKQNHKIGFEITVSNETVP